MGGDGIEYTAVVKRSKTETTIESNFAIEIYYGNSHQDICEL